MSGPEKAALIIALAVIVLVAFNVALWRRMKTALRQARKQTDADRDAERR